MERDDIKSLRRELRCTSRELAHALGVEAKLVLAWEDEQAFPTKRNIEAMKKLREMGKGSIVRMRSRRESNPSPFSVLEQPQLWCLFRKLLVHDDLRQQVLQLAENFGDPAEGDI